MKLDLRRKDATILEACSFPRVLQSIPCRPDLQLGRQAGALKRASQRIRMELLQPTSLDESTTTPSPTMWVEVLERLAFSAQSFFGR